jgi:ornithine decarboxylase
LNAGAYTTEYGTHFNGIEPPRIYFVDELVEFTEKRVKKEEL